MSHNNPLLTTACLTWQDNTPYNDHYQDYYYSHYDGIGESKYVYLSSNRLFERWQEYEKDKQTSFTILETGFGSGLNFLLTSQLWNNFQRKFKPRYLNKLNYLSIEGQPLSKNDLIKVINSWPQHFELSNQFIEKYSPAIQGIQQIDFTLFKIHLSLYFYPIKDALSQFEPKGVGLVDCLYLDGFAPSKNNSMWTQSVLTQLSWLCKPGATLSTFSCAKSIRLKLSYCGFQVKKIKGYAKKREILTAYKLKPTNKSASNIYRSKTPWYDAPKPIAKDSSVIIIGAGVSGCATANRLANSGFKCLLIDAGDRVAGTLRSFPVSLYSPIFSADFNLASQFYYHAYLHLSAYLKNNPTIKYNHTGIFKIAQTKERESKYKHLEQLFAESSVQLNYLSHQQISELSGVKINHGGLYLNDSGWLDPHSFSSQLINQENITCRFNTKVERIETVDGQWRVVLKNDQIKADAVILCGGAENALFDLQQLATTQIMHGYSFAFNLDQSLQNVERIISNKRNLIVRDKKLIVGSSYEHTKLNDDRQLSDYVEQLLAPLTSISPQFEQFFQNNNYRQHFYGKRLYTVDHMPLIGGVVDAQFYSKHYAKRLKGGSLRDCRSAGYIPGLYINSAHGSRGVTASLLAGSIISSLLSGEHLPISSQLYRAIHPARFLIRQMQR